MEFAPNSKRRINKIWFSTDGKIDIGGDWKEIYDIGGKIPAPPLRITFRKR